MQALAMMLEPQDSFITIMVVADSGFVNLCKDPQSYVATLKERINALYGNNVILSTVSGKYGIGHIDPTIISIEINDRNKTLFSQTLENSSMLFDELVAISIFEKDPFIETAREVVTTANKTFTHYRYPRKEKDDGR